MSNQGFQISINGGEKIRIGIDGKCYSVSCILSSIRGRENAEVNSISIDVGGLNAGRDHEYVSWIKESLEEGDRVLIEVVSDNFDEPSKIERRDSKEVVLEGKLKAYYALKQELKEYIED